MKRKAPARRNHRTRTETPAATATAPAPAPSATDEPPPPPPGMSFYDLLRVAVAITLGAFGLSLLPDLGRLAWAFAGKILPLWSRLALQASAWFLLVAATAPIFRRRPTRVAGRPVPAGVWERLDGVAAWALGGGLAAVLTAVVGVFFAGWLPHYLVWPWWTDTAYFALTAQAWDAGILPYRDLFDFNFPGPTYLHWLLGKAFGWGHTVPFQVFDAALLVALGLALATWSRRWFGATTPGLVGYLAMLVYYMSLSYSLVGQRDWMAPLFVVFALLMLETWESRWAPAAAGLLFALALSFRPHPVVLAPALLSALDEHGRRDGGTWKGTARAVAWCAAAGAVGLLLAAAPVVLAGVADDFLHWFGYAWYGGSYDQHQTSSRSFMGEYLGHFWDWKSVGVLAALAAMSVMDRPRGRLARTWALALLGVFLYKPLSPFAHLYLTHPLILVWSVGLAAVTGWAWTSQALAPTFRVVLVLTILLHIRPMVPIQWRPRASLVAVADLALGRFPAEPPPGCGASFEKSARTAITWDDYRRTLEYLRARTGPQTRVGGFFRNDPFPPVNAPVARLPLFPSPGGVLWLRYAAPGLEGPFIAALEEARDAVVVWTPDVAPDETFHHVDRIVEAVRRCYEPEASFGEVEIWRRKPVPPTEPNG